MRTRSRSPFTPLSARVTCCPPVRRRSRSFLSIPLVCLPSRCPSCPQLRHSEQPDAHRVAAWLCEYFEKALALLGQATLLDPDTWDAYFWKAIVLASLQGTSS